MAKRTPGRLGDVLMIPLGNGSFGWGGVLKSPLVAFYDYRSKEQTSLGDVVKNKILFKLWVMNYAIQDRDWRVVSNVPLEASLLVESLFFKKDIITGALSKYRDSTGGVTPVSREECAELECAAVWNPEHVVDRLNDHFAGRPNEWYESMRP